MPVNALSTLTREQATMLYTALKDAVENHRGTVEVAQVGAFGYEVFPTLNKQRTTSGILITD